MSELSDKVAKLAQESLIAFKEEYRTQDNLLEGLGIAIAQYCDWNGRKIAEVFRSALEDANYHQKAAIVEEWIERNM